MPPAAAFLHGAGIFGATKLSAQSFRAALSENEPRRDPCNHNHGESDD